MFFCCGNETARHASGASESDVMSAIVALGQDYLQASGLRTLPRPVNRQRAQLHLSMQSHAKKEVQGAEICFHPGSENSRRLAQLLQSRFSLIVPSSQTKLVPAPQLPELRMAKCPAIQLRLGNRENQDDAQWMLECTGVIAHAIAAAVAEWFDVPLNSPFAQYPATVHTPGGALALRSCPGTESELLRPLPNGTRLMLLHRQGDWQYVEAEDGSLGYVLRKYLRQQAEENKD